MISDYKPPLTRLSILENLFASYLLEGLGDFYLIGCQHLLPSTHLLLRSCFDYGLKPERTALIGKCYSTSTTTKTLMLMEGIYICPSSTQYNSHEPYDEQFQRNICHFLYQAIRRLNVPSHAKVIVLDDGGELLSAFNNLSTKFKQVVGVEQTSSGYQKLLKSTLKIPVINVARCPAKLIFESPMIIEAQTQAINKAINDLKLDFKKILIVGNGALGKYLKLALCGHYEVVCYDIIEQFSEINKQSLYYSNFDLIIGATGNSILCPNNISTLKKGTILASVSSSDREFNAAYFRKKIKKNINCHMNLFVEGIHILNSGFPINFLGNDEDSVPLKKIQLTIALLFAAIQQGISLPVFTKGLIDLNDNIQQDILKKFYELTQTFPLLQLYKEVPIKNAMSNY